MSNMKALYKKITLMFVSLFLSLMLFAEGAGNALFEQNKPLEAIPLLEADIAGGKATALEYNYLGLSYYQTGNYAKAAEAFTKGLSVPEAHKSILYYNLGNAYFALMEFQKSAEAFSMACEEDSVWAEPVLNRANARIKLDNLEGALEDYENYLIMVPESPQKEQIEQMIEALKKEIENRANGNIVKEEKIPDDEMLVEKKKTVEQEQFGEEAGIFKTAKKPESERFINEADVFDKEEPVVIEPVVRDAEIEASFKKAKKAASERIENKQEERTLFPEKKKAASEPVVHDEQVISVPSKKKTALEERFTDD